MTEKSGNRSEAVELRQRLTPVQARAKLSRDTILDVARDLLEEVGVDDFNTNLLAERAGVRIRTVYRYFPNKLSIIETISEELAERWTEWNSQFFAEIANPDCDLDATLRAMIETWIRRLTEEKGARAILHAVAVIPQLREIDRNAYAEYVGHFERAFTQRLTFPPPELTALCYVIVSSLYGLMECYFDSPADVRPTLAPELAEMISARLRIILQSAS